MKTCILSVLIFSFCSKIYCQKSDTTLAYQQWVAGAEAWLRGEQYASVMLENSIFAYANCKYWKSAIEKALLYAEWLQKKQQKNESMRWSSLAEEWSAEQFGNQNLYFANVIHRASELNYLNGDLFAAFHLLKKAAAIKKKYLSHQELIPIYQNIALWAEQLGNANDAYDAYHFLASKEPENLAYLQKLANISFENLDYWKSKNYLIQYWKKDNKDSLVLLKIAECYLNAGILDSSEWYFQQFQKKIHKNENLLPFQYFEVKGFIAKSIRAYQEAIDAFQIALKNPTISDFQKSEYYRIIGKIWLELSLFDNAEKYFLQAQKLANQNEFYQSLIVYDLALIAFHKRQYSKAGDLMEPVYPKLMKKMGRMHPLILQVEENLATIFFHTKNYEKSLYFRLLNLESANYSADKYWLKLKNYREINLILTKLYEKNPQQSILLEMEKYWKIYVSTAKEAISSHFSELLLTEIHKGFYAAAENQLKLYQAKYQHKYINQAFMIQMLWKKIKQKYFQTSISIDKNRSQTLAKIHIYHALILKESIKEEGSPLKIENWFARANELTLQLHENKFEVGYWFDPFTKSIPDSETDEAFLAYFMGTDSWIVFLLVDNQVFYYKNHDHYQLKNWIYLTQKNSEQSDLSLQNLYQKISEEMLSFPLKKLKKSKVKSIKFSLDDFLESIDIEKLVHLETKLPLSRSYFIEKKAVLHLR